MRFRIGKPLAYFHREYDPSNETHDLRIGFLSPAEAAQFRTAVLPTVLKHARESQSVARKRKQAQAG